MKHPSEVICRDAVLVLSSVFDPLERLKWWSALIWFHSNQFHSETVAGRDVFAELEAAEIEIRDQ